MSRIDYNETVNQASKRSWLHSRIIRLAFVAVLLLAISMGHNLIVNRKVIIPFETIAQAAESMSEVKSMHITARMCTLAGDNFDSVRPDAELAQVDMWQVTDNGTTKWRVEKPGRVVVMDGIGTLLVINPKDTSMMAAKFPPNAVGIIGWLSPLLHIDTLLMDEQEQAKKLGSKVSILEEKDQTGASELVLTINSEARGDFSQSDYLKNKTIVESDNTREYTFDAVTHRLKKMQVFMSIKGSKSLVFVTTAIQYDMPIDSSLLKAEIPQGARLLELPGQSVTAGNTAETPREAAKVILKDMSNRDWEALHAYAGTLFDDPKLQDMFGALKVISIGDPFRSGAYPGWFVPFEIKLRSGETRNLKLALRNDNSKHIWLFDGGL